jgi:hypothetical protein
VPPLFRPERRWSIGKSAFSTAFESRQVCPPSFFSPACVRQVATRIRYSAGGQTFIPAVRQKFIRVFLTARKPVCSFIRLVAKTFIRLVAKTFIWLVAKTFTRLVAKQFLELSLSVDVPESWCLVDVPTPNFCVSADAEDHAPLRLE